MIVVLLQIPDLWSRFLPLFGCHAMIVICGVVPMPNRGGPPQAVEVQPNYCTSEPLDGGSRVSG